MRLTAPGGARRLGHSAKVDEGHVEQPGRYRDGQGPPFRPELDLTHGEQGQGEHPDYRKGGAVHPRPPWQLPRSAPRLELTRVGRMAHLSDHALLLGRSAAGPAGLVFCVRFRLAPARAPRQILIRLLCDLLRGYRHKAVVHPDRRPAVVGKSSETRSVFPALQERVVLGTFLACAIAGPASYQGRAGDHGAIALGPPRLGTCAAHRERGEGARYQHSGHHYAQASRNCPSLPCWESPFRATIVALAGAQLLPQMSNFLP